MRVWGLLRLAVLTLMLVGCESGPGTETIRADLQAAIDSMEPGLLEVASIRAQGTGPAAEPGDDARVIAYVNVALELKRPHDFGNWAGPTIGTLASTLGAAARGVRGVRENGNAAGDRLEVYASAVYRANAQDGGWHYLGGGAPSGETDDVAAPVRTSSLVEQVEVILARGQANETTAGSRLAERELAGALAQVRQRIAETGSGIVMAGGPWRGEYARMGRGVAAVLSGNGLALAVRETEGSVENAQLVHSGQASFGIVQSDVLAQAYAAEGPFANGEPLFEMVALSALYPEPVHVVVRAESSLSGIRDLAGKRVGTGAFRSGTRLTATRVLKAHGLELADLAIVDSSNLSTAVARLANGDIDAVFVTIGAPSDELRRLAVRRAVRLLPLELSAVEQLTRGYRGYVAYQLPRRTYPGQSEAVLTIATTAVLVARRTTLDSVVESLLQAVFQGFDHDAAGSFQGQLVSPEYARSGLPIPLHLAAERYLDAIRPAPGS